MTGPLGIDGPRLVRAYVSRSKAGRVTLDPIGVITMRSRACYVILFIASVGTSLAITTLSGHASPSDSGARQGPVAPPVSTGKPLRRLKFATFDPLAAEPAVPPSLRATCFCQS